MLCDNLAKLHNIPIIFQQKYKYLFMPQKPFNLLVIKGCFIIIIKTFYKNNTSNMITTQNTHQYQTKDKINDIQIVSAFKSKITLYW